MNFPTVETMTLELNIDKSVAGKIRNAMITAFVPYAMRTINELLGTHGVEYTPPRTSDTFNDFKGLDYCNTGDTYTATVIFNHLTNCYQITDLGSIIEESPDSYP